MTVDPAATEDGPRTRASCSCRRSPAPPGPTPASCPPPRSPGSPPRRPGSSTSATSSNVLYVWGIARATGGRVVLRIEDHDRQRSRPEFEAAS